MVLRQKIGIVIGIVGMSAVSLGTAAVPILNTGWVIYGAPAADLCVLVGLGLWILGTSLASERPSRTLGFGLFGATSAIIPYYLLPMIMPCSFALQVTASFGIGVTVSSAALIYSKIFGKAAEEDSAALALLSALALGCSCALSAGMAPLLTECVATHYIVAPCITICASIVMMQLCIQSIQALFEGMAHS